MSIADQKVVERQYASSARLEARISIHAKYSRNKQPFGDWVSAHYALQPGDPDDLIAYLRSLAGMTVLADVPDDVLRSEFVRRMKDGVLSLPKEYGLFIARGRL